MLHMWKNELNVILVNVFTTYVQQIITIIDRVVNEDMQYAMNKQKSQLVGFTSFLFTLKATTYI